MNRTKAALRALAIGAALVALPLGLATPAQASTTSNGCTVDPVLPYHNGNFTAGGDKWINYEVDVTCVGGVEIEIQMQRWESDAGPSADDLIGTSTLTNTFTGAGSLTRTVTGVLPDTDDGFDLYEEMYHLVRFRVTNDPVTSAWTAWESSGIRSIHV